MTKSFNNRLFSRENIFPLASLLVATFAILALATASMAQEATQTSGYTPADVQTGVRQWSDSLRGIHVKLLYTERAGSQDHLKDWEKGEPIISSDIDAYIESSKLYFRRDMVSKNRPGSVVEDASWNGSKYMDMGKLPFHPDRFEGSVSARRGALIGGAYWQTLFGGRVFDKALPLADLLEENKITSLGTKLIHGRTSWGVSVSPRPTMRYEVWVDPLHGFAPIEISQILLNANSKVIGSCKMFDVELENSQAVFIPKQATISINGSIPGQLDLVDVKVQQIEVGLALPPDTFIIKFPRGTLVWDGILSLSYKVGESVNLEGSDGVTHQIKAGDVNSLNVADVVSQIGIPPHSPENIAGAAPSIATSNANISMTFVTLSGVLIMATAAILFVIVRKLRRS